ncbi:MAG: type IV pilus assembly protein PilX [Psychromonas sp.]|jgi:type IV pilus assembly protein PilX|uniref:pilus assembly PilX family protein n=1 Tax=Psychromonas sp. TaxID=1884585 RepID=UPI0039E5A214
MKIKKQSGAVLVISIVILLVLTFLVLSVTQSGVVQEKMTAAVRDSHISQEIAESGLRDAEHYIETLVTINGFNDTGNGGLYTQEKGPADLFDPSIWADSKTRVATTSVSGQLEASYYIEYLGIQNLSDDDLGAVNITGYGTTTGGGNLNIFKVVSRSLGANGNSERIVEIYYGKRL